ncbi:hypothetical protein D3C71_1221250 [compost metagenome]
MITRKQIAITRIARRQHQQLRAGALALAEHAPQRQLGGAPVAIVERVRQHLDRGIIQPETQLRAHLETVRQHRGIDRHIRQFLAHGFGQWLPAGEIARVVLAAGHLLAQRRHRHHHVVTHRAHQADGNGHPDTTPPETRPAIEQQRHADQQCQIARQRPMEADALHIGEEAQHEDQQGRRRAHQREIAPLHMMETTLRLTQASDRHGHHRRKQHRGDHQRLDQQEAQAFAMEHPRVALHHLEFQACILVVQVPGQQRQPRKDADRQRHPHARITQHAAAFGQQHQGDETHADDADEAVMAERTNRQTQRQHQRAACIHSAQQTCASIQTQHGSQRHRHIRHGEDAQRGRQRHQQRERARLPTDPATKPARGNARHQPRQQRAHQQERQAHTETIVAGHLHAQAGQPRRQTGEIGVRGSQMLPFLPVEGFVNEQRQL